MEGCKYMITDVCFEQIKGDYWYGAYEEFRVILNKNTGFLNATKICSSANKELYNWLRLKGMHELNQILQDTMVLQNSTMVLENTHTNIQNSGLTLLEYRSSDLRSGN